MSGKPFLLEIGTEELPSRFVPPALEQIRDQLEAALGVARISHGEVRAMGTPRRLAFLVDDVAERQPDRTVTVQGPARQACFDSEGEPTKALEGFARAQGADPSAVTFEQTDKGERATLIVDEPGRRLADVLAEALPRVVLCATFPKTMRWAHRKVRYGRPIRWLVALLGSEVVPFSIEDIASGRTTHGHRFLGSDRTEIASADAYVETLRRECVLVDPDERREEIRRQVLAVAREAGGEPVGLDEMLEENLYLVEWPTAFAGRFPEEFLSLPPVVPTTVLEKHQKLFPVADAKGNLLPLFVGVRNGNADNMENVIVGYEIVVHGRLEDGLFFFRNDMRRPLSDRVVDLDRVTFIQGLGTLREKTERVRALTDIACDQLGLSRGDRAHALRAAELCKADLTTSLVIEFTSLQGILGGVYAELSGEPEPVARAIGEHYRPASADDALPEMVLGQVLSVADKLDHVVGVLSIGEAPTGTADPHGVRRRLQGIASILMRRALPIDLEPLAQHALDLYEGGQPGTLDQFRDLLRQRAEAVLELEGVALELRSAVLDAGVSRLSQALAVARAIERLDASSPDTLTDAWCTATRPSNIISKRESDSTTVDPSLFEYEAEPALLDAADRIEAVAERFDAEIAAAPVSQRFAAVERATDAALRALAVEAPVVDEFFTVAMVMADDAAVRANRLAMLYRIYLAVTRVAALHDLNRM